MNVFGVANFFRGTEPTGRASRTATTAEMVAPQALCSALPAPAPLRGRSKLARAIGASAGRGRRSRFSADES